MKCKFPELKCVSRSGAECKLNICALDNVGTEVMLHKQIKKAEKICPILKKECIKRSCEWYCGSEECCRICNIMTRW